MRKQLRNVVVVSSLALALAACGTQTPPPPAPEPDVSATFYDPPGGAASPVLAAAIGIYDPTATVTAAASGKFGAALIDTGFGWHLGPVATIGPDGTVALEFPELDADLEALLLPVEEMVLGNDTVACPLTVSDDAVNATVIGFEGLTAPGVMAATVDGLVPGILSDDEFESVDLDAFAQNPVYGFVYVSGPVDVSATGAACEAQGTTIDVSLDEGWNWLKWEVLLDEADAFSHVNVTKVDMPDDVKMTAMLIL